MTGLTLPNDIDTLELLDCANNQLTTLDVSGADRLLKFNSNFNNLSQLQLPTTALGISINTGRRFWDVSHNQLKRLSIAITRNFEIDCGNNQLDSL